MAGPKSIGFALVSRKGGEWYAFHLGCAASIGPGHTGEGVAYRGKTNRRLSHLSVVSVTRGAGNL